MCIAGPDQDFAFFVVGDAFQSQLFAYLRQSFNIKAEDVLKFAISRPALAL